MGNVITINKKFKKTKKMDKKANIRDEICNIIFLQQLNEASKNEDGENVIEQEWEEIIYEAIKLENIYHVNEKDGIKTIINQFDDFSNILESSIPKSWKEIELENEMVLNTKESIQIIQDINHDLLFIRQKKGKIVK